jgi:hypothetical protein
MPGRRHVRDHIDRILQEVRAARRQFQYPDAAAVWDHADDILRRAGLDAVAVKLGRRPQGADPRRNINAVVIALRRVRRDLGDSRAPRPRRLTVNLPARTLTLDGADHTVFSEAALRWVEILVDNAGEWVSSADLEKADRNLLNRRTDQYKHFLPKQVLRLIDSRRGLGSRIRLRA